MVDVSDDVEVGMILGGWNVERPILIRSDGIVCSINDTAAKYDLVNSMPKYPQVHKNVNNIVYTIVNYTIVILIKDLSRTHKSHFYFCPYLNARGHLSMEGL